MFTLKTFKAQGHWSHFGAEIDVKNYRIFFKSKFSDVFCKKGALEYLAKLTEKPVYRSLFLKIVFVRRPATLLKKRLMHRFFSVEFLNLFKTTPL